ncbi:hypothetical protein [Planococcus sp. CAU13]|uniref:hypothetical protein n=1 Tax=Planococcus sp. CAU13 TaxID=1541197 RepID=UPI00052FE34F|nr:hypothetical protein [Planococcus sp. CAU13]
MEPLIVGLIILVASAFFGKKNKDETPSSTQKTVRSEPYAKSRNQGGFKRMEDYAKEIYGEFQAQMNTETETKGQAKDAAKQVVERRMSNRQSGERQFIEKQIADRQKSRIPLDEAPSLAAGEIGGRTSSRQKPVRQVQQAVKKDEATLFPLTQSEAQKAIILAEVFMPPKSKRR